MNMKSSAKPKSSPGRTDDFPPPLMMRFPRSKSSSSSSRGSRSRANPMFVPKINTAANEEPSSPKVTCIGQVRAKNTTTGTTAVRRCNWHPRLKPLWFRRVWRQNISGFGCGCCRKAEILQEQKQIETNQIKFEIGHTIGDDNDVFISESPPRNAFLLTRSRSAPYRSSSLASKFLESTKESEEDDDERGENVGRKTGVTEETEGINGDIGKENGEDEGPINGVEEFKAKPVKLSRCKSVPARTGDNLFMSFNS